jgi:hypothetical protein
MVLRNRLDGDVSVESNVAGAIDLAHCTCADHANDGEWSKRRSRWKLLTGVLVYLSQRRRHKLRPSSGRPLLVRCPVNIVSDERGDGAIQARIIGTFLMS